MSLERERFARFVLEALTVIGDAHAHTSAFGFGLEVACSEFHTDGGARGHRVFVHVGQRLLHHAKQGQLEHTGQTRFAARHLEPGWGSGLRTQPLERRNQAQIIKHTGPQISGESAHTFDGRVHIAANVPRALLGVVITQHRLEPVQAAPNRHQGLGGVIMQFPCDPAPFLLLRLREQIQVRPQLEGALFLLTSGRDLIGELTFFGEVTGNGQATDHATVLTQGVEVDLQVRESPIFAPHLSFIRDGRTTKQERAPSASRLECRRRFEQTGVLAPDQFGWFKANRLEHRRVRVIDPALEIGGQDHVMRGLGQQTVPGAFRFDPGVQPGVLNRQCRLIRNRRRQIRLTFGNARACQHGIGVQKPEHLTLRDNRGNHAGLCLEQCRALILE